jgi:hypothetical protein
MKRTAKRTIERYLHYADQGIPYAEHLAGALAAKAEVEKKHNIYLGEGKLIMKHGRPCFQFDKVGDRLVIARTMEEATR